MSVSEYLFWLAGLVGFLTLVRFLKWEGWLLTPIILGCAIYYS